MPQRNGRSPVNRQREPKKLGDGVPTYAEMTRKYNNKPGKLSEDHEKLIEQILEEEERLIQGHNKVCKSSIQIVEDEMRLLKSVDKPGSDVEKYVVELDKILEKKIKMMTDLRSKALEFYKNLKTEETMAKFCQNTNNI